MPVNRKHKVKPKQIELNGEYIGQLNENVFHFDQIRMVGYPHHTAIEREAVEMAQLQGAKTLCAEIVHRRGRIYCEIALALRVTVDDKETNGKMLLVDDDHWYASPEEAHEYAMRMAMEERK